MSRIYEEDIHTNKHNQIYTQKHVDFVSIFVVLVLAAGLPVPCALGLGCVTLEDHTRQQNKLVSDCAEGNICN